MNHETTPPNGALSGALRAVLLVWSDVSEPNDDCHYTHTKAETPFGRFLLTWKSWKDYPDYGFDETPWGKVVYLGWNSIESAKQWAAEEMALRIQQMQFATTPNPTPRDEGE